MEEDSTVCDNALIIKRDQFLPTILSNLSNETEISALLSNIQQCVEYIPTYTISELDQQLLQWLMPPLKIVLIKALDDNTLLTETCNDEFIVDILRDNLNTILYLLQILKDILNLFIGNGEIQLKDIKTTSVISIQMMTLTFDHCRKSSESYKSTFNQELLDIFKVIQEIHTLFFQLFDNCVYNIDTSLEINTEVAILIEVLDNVCTISAVLSSLNMKLLVSNWKGYLAILQKYFSILKNHNINIKRPITNLSTVIYENFILMENPEVEDLASVSRNIKISGFLVKVLLKIFELCWDFKENIITDMVQFCCMIYSFSPCKFEMMQYPEEIIALTQEMIFTHIKSFVNRFIQNESFLIIITNKSFLSENNYFGLLNLLNVYLESLIINETTKNPKLDIVIKLIFDICTHCFEEFFWPSNLFEDLIINISGAVLTYNKSYKKIELILLENILQEDIWCYFLALDVWCLILRNSNPKFCADVLFNLIKIYGDLEFGEITYRLENVYLKYLIFKIYLIVPDYLKCQKGQNIYNGNIWKKFGFIHYPMQMKSVIEELNQITVKQFEELGTDKFSIKDFIVFVENLEALSSVNFQSICVCPMNLVNAVESMWELSFTDTNNNLFRYFIAKVFKITSSLALEFNNKQLYMVLTNLNSLCSQDIFKLNISLIISSFCYVNPNQLGQDGCKIFRLISSILTSLLCSSNDIIKQIASDAFMLFKQNGKNGIVRDVVMSCNNMNMDVSVYLQNSSSITIKFDKSYLKTLKNIQYTHTCIEWKDFNNSKRIKLDYSNNNPIRNTCEQKSDAAVLKEQNTGANANSLKYKLKEFKFKPHKNKNENTEDRIEEKVVEEESDDIDDVLIRLKGEVKCLLNVMKTEKLKPKNASDLKIMINQLSSLL